MIGEVTFLDHTFIEDAIGNNRFLIEGVDTHLLWMYDALGLSVSALASVTTGDVEAASTCIKQLFF